MTDAVPDDLAAIDAALAQLRGRGRFPGPRGPFGPPGVGGGHGIGGHHGHPGFPGREWPGGSDGDSGSRRGRSGGPGGWPAGPWGGGPGGVGGPGMRGGGPARLRLLEALASASHPLTVSEVGEAIGVDQPRASRLIQQAVDLGLVRREADPDDARRTRVALTEEGARIARGFRGQRREHLTQALADFTPDERADLARLLAKLAAAWPQH